MVTSIAMSLTRPQRIYLAIRGAVEQIAARLLPLGVWLGSLLSKQVREASLEWSHRLESVRRGEASFAGPSVACMSSDGAVLRPGLVNEAAICGLMGMDCDEADRNREYARRVSPRTDATLLARFAWARLLNKPGGEERRPYFNLLGVIVNNAETDSIVRTVFGLAQAHRHLPGAAHVAFVNAHNFNVAAERPEYLAALRHADLVLPDGIGVKLALRMAGGALRKNLNGTDLFPLIAAECERRRLPVFFLGAEPKVLNRAIDNITRRFPRLPVAGSRDGYFGAEDEKAIACAIRDSGARIVVVGMGTPRQELWAARNLDRLPGVTVLCLGGLLDFLGEKNRRAPMWMRQMGMEWVFRLLQEPGRMWRRYLVGNPLFLWRVRRWLHSPRPAATGRKAFLQ